MQRLRRERGDQPDQRRRAAAAHRDRLRVFLREGDKVLYRAYQFFVGIIEAQIDPDTGLLARPGQKGITEYFLPGTVPTEQAPDQDTLSTSDWMMREVLEKKPEGVREH